jgi:hypothetical protein
MEWENLYSNSVYLKYFFYRVYCDVNSASVLYHTIYTTIGKVLSSKSRNLSQFLQFSYCTVYTVKEKGGKPNRNAYPPPLPFDFRNPQF